MSKKILIADDNEDLRLVIVYQLEALGFSVIQASDGDEAVSKAISDLPDLILLDVIMPGKDGTQAGAEILENKKTKHIPLIYLTNLIHGDEGQTEELILKSGMSIPKNISVEKLAQIITKILSGPSLSLDVPNILE